MSFAARYQGRCASDDCTFGDPTIHVGDEVAFADDELMHIECAANATFGAHLNLPPLCRSCWQHHNGECL